MIREQRKRLRDQDTERRERLRYGILERLYLLSGVDGFDPSTEWQDAILGLSLEGCGSIMEDLEILGYLERAAADGEYRITERGTEYLQYGAWRRRTIRA